MSKWKVRLTDFQMSVSAAGMAVAARWFATPRGSPVPRSTTGLGPAPRWYPPNGDSLGASSHIVE